MVSRSSDVNLVIRARNDASRTIESVGDALEALLGDAHGASGGVADLGATLARLDKVLAAISGRTDAAGAAFQRQQATLAANRAELAAVAAQSESAARAVEGLRARIVDEVLAGRDQAPIIAQIKAVQQEQAALASRADKLTRTIATQEATLNSSQSSLLQLSATVHAVEDAQAEAAARIELTTQALNEQAAAAQRVTAIQQRINDVTGVSRPPAAGSAAAASSVLIEADNIFRRAEARDAEIRKLREQEAATAALADAERAEQANRVRFNVTEDPRGGQARASAAAFIAAAEAEERMALEAAQLRAQLDPLASIQERYNGALARYRQLAAAGKIGTDELARAEQHLAAEAERARAAIERGGAAAVKPALFGLKPYELTNLGYQINDVATQLASGTSLTQTLAQQAGQVLQIFPRITSGIVGAFGNPLFLGSSSVALGIALGLKEAADQAERLRTFTAALSLRPDAAGYDAANLTQQAEALERLGASAKDADAALNAFIDQGVAADAIAGLGRAAQETAERLGQSLPDAAKAAAEAFTAGFDAVAQFDDKLKFLTASERERIRALFDAGNAEAGRTEARLAYQRLEDGIAARSRGPWQDAARSLGTAWDSLLKFIGDSTPIRATLVVLNELAEGVKEVGDAISSALGSGAPSGGGGTTARIGELQAQIRELQKTIRDYEGAITSKSPIAGTLRHLVAVSKQQLATAEAELARLERNAPDTANDDPNGIAAKRRAERLADLTAEQQLQALRQRGQTAIGRADAARRTQLAGELAYRQEMAATGDAIVAGRLREAAVAREQAEIDKANDAARKAAASAREREIRQFESRVVGAEGGTAKNPYSSARGYGQFTESTFLDVYRRTPGADQNLGREQILALRNNERVARGVIDQYARENARFLESFGAKATAGNLYLAHFLGAGGAKAVLTAPGTQPVDQIIRRLPNAGAVLTGNQGYLRKDNGRGRYRTAGELQTFIAGRVGDTGAAQSDLVEEQARIARTNVERQEALNQAIRHGNEDRQRSVDALRAEAGLYGTALLAEQRRQAVAAAELELRQRADDANRALKPGEAPVVVTDAQVATAKELAASLFDVQHAREALGARLADAQRPLDALTAERDLLREQAEYLRSIGEEPQAASVEEQMRGVGASIRDAYTALIAFYEALSPTDRVQLGIIDEVQLDNIIAKLRLARGQTQEWGRVLGVSGQQVAQAFAGAAANALNSFIERVASGRNVFKALGQSVREFAASFISSIAQALTQLIAFGAAVQILRALGVPIPAGISVGSFHRGGVVGAGGGARRAVQADLFAAAMRYHRGGIAGLAPDEVPAILRRNEEVLTEADPRHRYNGGLDGKPESRPAPINIVNAFDREQAAEMLLRTKAGERAILNIISDNQGAVRAALG